MREQSKAFLMIKNALSFAVLLTLGFQPSISQEIKEMSDPILLERILSQTRDYCEKLKNLSLDYFCRENISETTFNFTKQSGGTAADNMKIAGSLQNSFVYDYQMIKKGSDFKERRNLLEENGKKRDEKDVTIKTMRISLQYLVFGPVGFLSQYWQTRFHYKLEGRDDLDGKTAVILAVSPTEVREENYYSGRIWVDEADSSILKIEWDPQSLPGYIDEVSSSIGTLKRKMVMTTVYGTVYKGIRFPSAQTIKEMFVTSSGQSHTKYTAEYQYDQFKYFTVETSVNIK